MNANQRHRGAKTLDNGLEVLNHITQRPGQLTLTEVSSLVGIHPTSTHRLITSLEAAFLVRRDSFKRLHPGYGLIRLAASVDQSLKTTAEPFLRLLTDRLGATSHLVVAVSDSDVVAQLVVQPQNSRGHVAFSPGRIDPIDKGSAGIAILSSRLPNETDTLEVKQARLDGYATSLGVIVPNVLGVSAPIRTPDGLPDAAIGVSLVSKNILEKAVQQVVETANEIENLLTH